MGIPQPVLARHFSIPVQRFNAIEYSKRGVIPDMAWLLT
jgi:hypothetical protein